MSLRDSALADMIGPAVFAFIVVVLTLAQYGFMIGVGPGRGILRTLAERARP